MTRLASSFRFHEGFLRFLTSDFDAAAWGFRPADSNGNTPHWLVGHLVVTRRWLARKLGDQIPVDDWEEAFARGARPGESLPGPAPAELVETCASHGSVIRERLDDLDAGARDAAWEKELPDGGKTVWDAMHFYAFHENYHLGQIGLLRAQMGRPGIP